MSSLRTENSIKSVVIYCASSHDIHPSYFDTASLLGEKLAENRIEAITGAGMQGLMGAVNDSILEHGGKITGVIPRFMVDSGWCHQSLSELIVTETMHERKSRMAEMSDAAIALPGGFGTLEELMEILTWKQLGLYRKPIIILNAEGFYNQLLQFFDNMISEKFLNPEYKNLYEVAETVTETIEILKKNKNQISFISKYERKVL